MPNKDFLLPDLGEGLTEGEVVSWLVAVGDTVEVDQYVAEVETAKAVVEVPTPFAGTVVTLHGEPGQEIAVGSPLITIDVGGDTGDATAEEPAAAAAPAEDTAEEEGSGNVLVGYGTSGGGGSRRRRVTSGNGAGAADSPLQAEKVQRDGRPMAKPPVRKLAKDLGVDLDYVLGSGPDGIITRADVEAAAGAAVEEPADRAMADAAASTGSAAAGARTDRASTEGGVLITDDEGHRLTSAPPNVEPVAIPEAPEGALAQERVKLSQLRKAVTAQMTRSRGQIPEAVTWVEADATPLWEFRAQLNRSQSAVKVSPTAIIMRMAIAALRRFPTINASLDTTTEEMVLHRHVNLGFAAQTDRGLVVPVIRNAHEMNIVELARTLNEMADKARAGKLSPADMAGGTFTISNYGAFGVDGGDMVINHPEAAILGTGRITDKPWVVDGDLAVRKVITYSIAFDHRIIDGGEGAGFIRYLADLTENPTLLTAAL